MKWNAFDPIFEVHYFIYTGTKLFKVGYKNTDPMKTIHVVWDCLKEDEKSVQLVSESIMIMREGKK